MPIVAIAILIAMHLYKRGLASIDKIKTLYNKIKTLFNKTKKSAKDYLARMDANPEIYILEIV